MDSIFNPNDSLLVAITIQLNNILYPAFIAWTKKGTSYVTKCQKKIERFLDFLESLQRSLLETDRSNFEQMFDEILLLVGKDIDWFQFPKEMAVAKQIVVHQRQKIMKLLSKIKNILGGKYFHDVSFLSEINSVKT